MNLSSVILEVERNLLDHIGDVIVRGNLDHNGVVLLLKAFENVLPSFISFLDDITIVVMLTDCTGFYLSIRNRVGFIVYYAGFRIDPSKV